MLPITCALIFASPDIQFDIPVRNVRPTRIVSMLFNAPEGAPLLSKSASVEADDDKWVIHVSGNADDVLGTRKFVRLVDVKPLNLRLTMRINSPADKLDLETITTIPNGNKWRMTEDAINSTIALSPRLNSDGTCTFVLLTRYDGGEMTTSFRIREGEAHKISLGNKHSTEVREKDQALDVKEIIVPGPTLTISYKAEKK